MLEVSRGISLWSSDMEDPSLIGNAIEKQVSAQRYRKLGASNEHRFGGARWHVENVAWQQPHIFALALDDLLQVHRDRLLAALCVLANDDGLVALGEPCGPPGQRQKFQRGKLCAVAGGDESARTPHGSER